MTSTVQPTAMTTVDSPVKAGGEGGGGGGGEGGGDSGEGGAKGGGGGVDGGDSGGGGATASGTRTPTATVTGSAATAIWPKLADMSESGRATSDEAAAATTVTRGLALLPKGPWTSGMVSAAATWTPAGETVALSRHSGSRHSVNVRSVS